MTVERRLVSLFAGLAVASIIGSVVLIVDHEYWSSWSSTRFALEGYPLFRNSLLMAGFTTLAAMAPPFLIGEGRDAAIGYACIMFPFVWVLLYHGPEGIRAENLYWGLALLMTAHGIGFRLMRELVQ